MGREPRVRLGGLLVDVSANDRQRQFELRNVSLSVGAAREDLSAPTNTKNL